MTTSGQNDAAGEISLIAQRMAQVQAFRARVPDMPREAVRGYPVPFMYEGGVYLAVPFFLRRGLPPAPPQVGEPAWVIYVDANSGLKLSFRRLSGNPTVMLGTHQIEPRLDSTAFAAAEERFYQLLADLLSILRNPGAGVPAALTDRAILFVRLWRQLSHRALQSHYRALNPAWFDALGI